ncbi:MAG: homoserine kinase [Chloroflexi bacterium]|nr:homoserine kinase [Chloroflexota bacterium]
METFAPFSVEVPATTANLGPGFDCLGLALDLWNRVTVRPANTFALEVTGEGVEGLPLGEKNLVYQTAIALFRRLGQTPPPMRLLCENRIPLTRGLGSSAAATVAGLMVANHLTGETLSPSTLVERATEIEGHPDNAAPAVFGGCQIVVQEDRAFRIRAVPLAPGLECSLFVPEVRLATEQARAVLPTNVPRADAVFNVGRTALLVNALATGSWEDLRAATEDRLHQPYREALFPPMKPLFQTALAAGALGVFLSGSGPSVLAFALKGRGAAVAKAMETRARAMELPGSARVVAPSARGARIVTDVRSR